MKRIAVLSGLLALAAGAVRGDDFPHLGGDAARGRAPAAETLLSPAAFGLPIAAGEEMVASPVAADGFLLTASLDGTLRAYRDSDRAPLWTVELGALVIATPAIGQGRVFIACTDGVLRIRRLADGAALATIATGSSDLAAPLVQGGKLYLASGFPETRLAVYDAVTGAETGSFALDQVTNAAAALAPGLILTACNSGRLTAIDATTFTELWSRSLGGNVASAAPSVAGSDVWVLSENVLHQTSLAGAAGVSLTISDPAPPAGAFSVERAGSSLSVQGDRIAGVVRFTYAFDTAPVPDGYPDAPRTVREFAFLLDTTTLTLLTPVSLGAAALAGINELPPYRIVPSPVALGAAGGFAFSSGISTMLRILRAADGVEIFSADLLEPGVASPCFANARLHALTRGGTLHGFQGSNAPPAAVAGLAPDGLDVQTSPVALTWTASPEPGVAYTVRADDDGEILEDWLFETSVAAASASTPVLPSGRLYTWSVRVRDSGGAWSPWSAAATFGQDVPPAPPGALGAEARHSRVLLSWTASPSNDVTGYRLRSGPSGGPLGAPVELGAVTAAEVSGLVNGTAYDFSLVAVDVAGNESSAVTATATPESLIRIGGVAFDSIGAALAAAQAGDVVALGADVFRLDAPVTVPPGVELRGVDAKLTRLEAAGDFAMIELRPDATLRRLSLSGGRIGARVPEGPALLANLVVRDMTDAGIEVAGTASVVNCTIAGNGGAGVRASGTVSARNNIVQGNGVGFEGPVASTYNTVADGYSGTAAGTGDSADAVEFQDAAAGDYREKEAQPSTDAGDPSDDYDQEPQDNGSRVNRGAFGNTSEAARSGATVVAPSPDGDDGGTAGQVCGTAAASTGGFPSALVLAFLALLLGFATRR